MKKICFFFIAISFGVSLQAQIVNIPDANFKAKLLAADTTNNIAKDSNINWIKIDINNDGNIDITEASRVAYLVVADAGISDLTGIEQFSNLINLSCPNNQ